MNKGCQATCCTPQNMNERTSHHGAPRSYFGGLFVRNARRQASLPWYCISECQSLLYIAGINNDARPVTTSSKSFFSYTIRLEHHIQVIGQPVDAHISLLVCAFIKKARH